MAEASEIRGEPHRQREEDRKQRDQARGFRWSMPRLVGVCGPIAIAIRLQDLATRDHDARLLVVDIGATGASVANDSRSVRHSQRRRCRLTHLGTERPDVAVPRLDSRQSQREEHAHDETRHRAGFDSRAQHYRDVFSARPGAPALKLVQSLALGEAAENGLVALSKCPLPPGVRPTGDARQIHSGYPYLAHRRAPCYPSFVGFSEDKLESLRQGEACLMGVLNTTPDSFYDGGRYLD